MKPIPGGRWLAGLSADGAVSGKMAPRRLAVASPSIALTSIWSDLRTLGGSQPDLCDSRVSQTGAAQRLATAITGRWDGFGQ